MKEIEIKFKLKSPQTIRAKLQKIGAKFIKKVFEENLRFDDKKRGLISEKNSLLRLRKDDRIRLTFKGKGGYYQKVEEEDEGLKIAEEIEVEVDNFSRMKKILEKLGFKVASQYQKIRETWHYHNLEIVVDQVPYLGYFLELEGPSKSIRKTANLLGLDLKNGITRTYAKLWKEYCKKHRIKSRNMLFKK